MTHKWQHVKAPWREGQKPYTYLLPPELGALGPDDVIMVEKPKGGFLYLFITEVGTLAPLPFPCKPVANGWLREDFEAEMAAARAEHEGTGEMPPEPQSHESYPAWQATAARINNGEEADSDGPAGVPDYRNMRLQDGDTDE